MSTNYEANWSTSEMKEIDPQRVEVQILGRVLEGHGAITSELTEQDWPAVAEAIRQSADRIQQTEYSSCIDGRQTIELANGEPEKLRPRKAGGGLTPFIMRGLASAEFRRELDTLNGRQELFQKVSQVNHLIGRKESAHAGVMPDGTVVFDCGAAGGMVEHVGGLATATLDGPNVRAVFSLMSREIPASLSTLSLLHGINTGAKELRNILSNKDWDGKEYVVQLMERDPEAVELLEARPDEVHGHDEKAVIIVDEDIEEGDEPIVGINKSTLKDLAGIDAFVINLNEFRRGAKMMAPNKEDEARFILSNLLYHTEGVYKHLGDGSHPVFYLKLAA